LYDAAVPAPDGIHTASFTVPKGVGLADLVVWGELHERSGNSALSSAATTLTMDGIGPEHGGQIITQSETWAAADSPHFIGADTRFELGADLTVEAGAAIVFESDAILWLRGGVQLVGTAQQPIVLVDGYVLIDSVAAEPAFDALGAYVAGPRFEHVQGPKAALSLSYTPGGGYGTLYVRDCVLEALLGKFPDNFSGSIVAPVRDSYVGFSRIGLVGTEWYGSRTYRIDLGACLQAIKGYALHGAV
jgi:hypothetical protein